MKLLVNQLDDPGAEIQLTPILYAIDVCPPATDSTEHSCQKANLIICSENAWENSWRAIIMDLCWWLCVHHWWMGVHGCSRLHGCMFVAVQDGPVFIAVFSPMADVCL